jgi:restriction endonuclease S subunit
MEQPKAAAAAWYPEVPPRWKYTRLKYEVHSIKSGGTPDTQEYSYWADRGDEKGIPWVAISDMSSVDTVTTTEKRITAEGLQSKGLNRFPVGTLLYSMYASVGKIAVLGIPATINQAILAIDSNPRKCTPRYLRWALAYITERILETASTNTQDNLNLHKVRNALMLLPPLECQDEIANFLERETSHADALISKYEKLVQFLDEKRDAVITAAVTKGIRPRTKMKSSGSDWLGDIPSHWKCLPLKRSAKRIVVGLAEATTHAYADDGVAILRSTNIRANRIVGTILYIDPEFAADRGSKSIRGGDLVTVRTGDPGVTAVVPSELDNCQCFTMLITSLKEGHLPDFFAFAINSDYGRRFFAVEGWGSAQANISVPILKAFPIAIPPLSEQVEICAYLAEKLASLTELKERALSAVLLLTERRNAVVTDAITGRGDVGKHSSGAKAKS